MAGKGRQLVGQLIADKVCPKEDAQAVAMLAALAEAGRPLIPAARAAGLQVEKARTYAAKLGITFASGGPAR